MLRKPRPEDFKPVSEAPAVRRAQAVLEKAEARAREAAAAVAEMEQELQKAREAAIDALLKDEEPDGKPIETALQELEGAREANNAVDGAVEKARAQLAQAMAEARRDLVEKLTEASKEAARLLDKRLATAFKANEAVRALWRRADELGVSSEVPPLFFTGKFNPDAFAIWRKDIASYATKPRRPRTDLVTVRFIASPPQEYAHLLGAAYAAGDVAGFEPDLAARMVREQIAIYADDPSREPPEEPKPEPIEAAPGDVTLLRFRRRWSPGLGRPSYMCGDVAGFDPQTANALVSEGIATVVEPDDDAPTAAPAPAPAPVAGQTGAPALEVREDA